ncbi:MAG: hypothetical protein ACFFCW_41170 [Candidatus Hodarchaeota archaeon]
MRSSNRIISLVCFMAVGIAFTILTVAWGFELNWPDNVHVNYGFPLTWATHTLSTIAGPVDIWKIDLSALIMDLLLWLGLMLVAVTWMLYRFNKMRMH